MAVARDAEPILRHRWTQRIAADPLEAFAIARGDDGTRVEIEPVRAHVTAAERRRRDRVRLDFQGVYRVSRDGALHREPHDFDQPNGLCLLPDEKTLYVNDATDAHISPCSTSHLPAR